MAFRGKLGKAFFCAALAFASFGGAAMRPEEIEELMANVNKPKIAHTLRDERDNGDDFLKQFWTAGRPDSLR